MKKSIKRLVSSIMVLSLLIIPLSSMYSNALTTMKQDKDIVQIATDDGRFNTLVEALKSAGLVDTLKGEGPFTVFAPTDDAFNKLPQGTVDDLLKPENKETLTNILLYHVAKGNLSAKDIVNLDGKELTLQNGKTAKVTVKNGEVFINDAKVIITDIKAKNGVIHVIDTVLIPK